MHLKTLLAIPLLVLGMMTPGQGERSDASSIFSFTFDGETENASGPSQFSFYGEMLRDFGITRMNRLSKPHAAFVVADFSEDSWGVIMLSHPGHWDLSEAHISVAIRTPDSFHGVQGIVGFKLIDANGKEVRTRDADLHMPGRYWNIFSQRTSDITLSDSGGADADVDLKNIVQVGVIIFDPPPTDSQAISKFFIDDLRAAN